MATMQDELVIGSMHAPNRIVRAATAESLATRDGRPTHELETLYEELARGGAGTIITGYAYVAEDGKPSENALSICNDAGAAEYRALVRRVHAGGARIVMQLVYGGSKSKLAPDDLRRGVFGTSTAHIVGPSATEHPKTHIVPLAATCTDLRRIVEAFGDAARRAKEYGFDGVELHAAHGYLLSQFLSSAFNRRTDEYGGTLQNRARLAVACVRRIRAAVGDGFPVLVKVNNRDASAPAGISGHAGGEACAPARGEGLSEDESALVCSWLVEAGASAIDVSGDWHAFAPGDVDGNPFFAAFGARLARDLDVPVIVTGGWRRPDIAQLHLAQDGIAALGLSRPLVREPDLPLRWLSGDASPSRCTSCTRCAKAPGLPCPFKDAGE